MRRLRNRSRGYLPGRTMLATEPWPFLSRRLLLEVLLPLSKRGEPVHHGAMGEGALRSGDVLGFARPGLLRRRLQRAAIAEAEPPGQAAELVHGVEVGGRLFVRLVAGEEGDARHRGGVAGPAALHCLL